VASWAEFATAAPDIADPGSRRLAVGIAYLATTSGDGRPQLHPVTPLIAEGRLFVFVALNTPKERSLRRDGRYALHAALGKDDEEFLISGRAVVADDAHSRSLAHKAAEAIGMTTRDDVLMEFMVERAYWAIWEGLGTADISKKSKRWQARG
jgi:hypothetical protein